MAETDIANEGDLDAFKKMLTRLNNRARQAYLAKCDAYYELEQPLAYMAPALVAEFGDKVAQVVINWPRLGADSYEERLDIEGFRLPGAEDDDDTFGQWWEYNSGSEKAQQAHVESIALGLCNVTVGTNPLNADAPAVFTPESPFLSVTRSDPRVPGDTLEGVKVWKDDDGGRHGTLYLADRNIPFDQVKGKWEAGKVDRHGFGECMMTPLINKPRLLRLHGRSQFHDVLPIADAANRMASDMMVSGRYHAMPRRWAKGIGPEDFKDPVTGEVVSTWSMVAGRIWTTTKKATDVEYGQFPEATLSNFHDSIKVLAALATQVLALPFHYLSFGGDNPPSADAIRSSETRLVKGAERMAQTRSGPWERVARQSRRIEQKIPLGSTQDLLLRRMETRWRDPSTPTVAQKADAVVKLTGGAAVIPPQQARQDLGYTKAERDNMDAWDEKNRTDPTFAALNKPLATNPPQPANAGGGG